MLTEEKKTQFLVQILQNQYNCSSVKIIFDLFEQKSSNPLTSFGEYTKSTICENTQERERNTSSNEISLDER